MDGIKKTLIAVLALVVIAAFSVVGYFNFYLQPSEVSVETPEAVVPTNAQRAAIEPRISDDIDYYTAAREKVPEEWSTQKAKQTLFLADAYIAKGGKENIAKASELVRGVIADEKNVKSHVRARAMESLGSMICRTGVDISMIPVVYADDFSKYIQGTDRKATVHASKTMAEMSYKTFPNSRAAVSIARANAFMLTYEKQTPENAQALLLETVSYLQEAKRLAPAEFAEDKDQAAEASYYFWRAVSYGQIAALNKEYIEPADEAYAELFAYIDGVEKRSGDRYNTAATEIVGFAYFRYATYLKSAFGATRKTEITKTLNDLMAFMSADPHKERSTVGRYFSNREKLYKETKKRDISLEAVLQLKGYSNAYDAYLNSLQIPNV